MASAGDPRPSDKDCLIQHASAVAHAGRAVVITGPSGAGKSGLALQLMALGAGLVSDDRCCLWRHGDDLFVDAPAAIRGRIEARHLGILNAEAVGPARVAAYISLEDVETQRLPDPRNISVLGLTLPLLHTVQAQHFAPAILQYLKAGRWA